MSSLLIKKLIAFLLGLGVTGGVTVGATDSLTNPYSDRGDHYEITIAEELVKIDKDSPTFTLERWDEEITISRAGSFGISDKQLLSKVRTIDRNDGKESVIFEPKEEGVKIDIVLNEKSETNVFDLQIGGWENYEWYYQPPLDEDPDALNDPEVASCTPTLCVNEKGEMVLSRPENVVGSYAVYRKDGKFQTGKAFHIYRPKIIDALGREIWGTLTFFEGVLSVIAPQEFLDTATYPVRIDPDFGKTNIGGSTGSTGRIFYYEHTAPESGTVNSMSWYGDDGAAAGTALGTAIYNDNGTNPGTLGAQDTGNSTVDAAAWYTNNISFAITGGTSYWLAFWGAATMNYRYDVGTNSKTAAILTFENWPDPASIDSSSTRIPSLYATYTATPVATGPRLPSEGIYIENATINGQVGFYTNLPQTITNAPIVVSNLDVGIGTGDPQSTNIITPTAGAVLYLTIGISYASEFPPDALTVSGVCTWTKLGTTNYAARRTIWLYRGTSCSGTNSVAIEQTGAGTVQEVGWVIDQATGLDPTTPDSGLTVDTAGGSGVTSRTVTVGGTPGAGDATYASQVLESNINMNVEAGWAALGQTTTGSLGVRRIESGWDDAADPSMAWTWDGSSQGTGGFAIILED